MPLAWIAECPSLGDPHPDAVGDNDIDDGCPYEDGNADAMVDDIDIDNTCFAQTMKSIESLDVT